MYSKFEINEIDKFRVKYRICLLKYFKQLFCYYTYTLRNIENRAPRRKKKQSRNFADKKKNM